MGIKTFVYRSYLLCCHELHPSDTQRNSAQEGLMWSSTARTVLQLSTPLSTEGFTEHLLANSLLIKHLYQLVLIYKPSYSLASKSCYDEEMLYHSDRLVKSIRIGTSAEERSQQFWEENILIFHFKKSRFTTETANAFGNEKQVQLPPITEGPDVQLPALCMAPSAASTSRIIQNALWRSGQIKQKVGYSNDVG